LKPYSGRRGVPLEIVVVDNASTDGTLQILKEFGTRIRILGGDRNVGFAEAQNRVINPPPPSGLP